MNLILNFTETATAEKHEKYYLNLILKADILSIFIPSFFILVMLVKLNIKFVKYYRICAINVLLDLYIVTSSK